MKRLVLLLLTAVLAGIGLAQPAGATAPAALDLKASTVVTHTKVGNDVVTMTGHRDAAVRVRAAGTDASLVGSRGHRLASALAAGAVYQTGWSQAMQGCCWKEVHAGLFYFDGSEVWVADHNGYNSGWHQCDLGWAVGYDIVPTACPVYGDPNGYMLSQYDYFKVHVIARWLPVSYSHAMHVNVYTSGSIYWH